MAAMSIYQPAKANRSNINESILMKAGNMAASCGWRNGANIQCQCLLALMASAAI